MLNSELELLKQEIKNRITEFVQTNQLEDAKRLIDEYESMIQFDIEIYSIKGVIALLENDYEQAEVILKEGIVLDGEYFDILYNLAYLYEMTGRYADAVRFYKRSLKYCKDYQLKEQIEETLKRISVENNFRSDVIKLENFKKVLVIAYYFPPLSGSGVQRTLKFVKNLRDFGWEPIVVTVGESNYPLKDKSLLLEIPDDIEIIRIDDIKNLNNKTIEELLSLYDDVINNKEIMSEFMNDLRKSKELLYQLAVTPDKAIFWANNVLKNIDYKVDFNEIDLIYTTSGPYSDHLIGYQLKNRYFKPWIADFRDEWTNNPYATYHSDTIKYKMDFSMERTIVKNADKVITTTPIASENYRKTFDLKADKVVTITNGYDESDFADLNLDCKSSNKFTIIHNGLLYLIRTPRTFLEAVSNLIQRRLIDKSKIKIVLTEDEHEWISVIKEFDLEGVVQFTGYLSHRDSLIYASKANALLLIVGPGEKNKSVYPGKIFEYLRLKKPILALSPNGSLVENLINDTKRGINVDFDDIQAIEEAILSLYINWERNQEIEFKIDDKITIFERKNITRQLVNLFDEQYKVWKNKKSKKKICFFTIRNGDKFLGDIIDNLGEEYEVRKVIVTKYEQIDKGMAWADICWFDWCDDLLIYASNHELAKEKTIISRLHSYEVFTDNPNKVNWFNVDTLIIVANHIYKLFKLQVPDIEEKVRVVINNNGVNLNKYKFKKREKGYNIAFVGYMIPTKNPMLLLQIVKKLVEIDPKYKVYIAGHFKDDKLKLYWDYAVNELDLSRNVIFQGFQPNISEWLEDKNYILSTTMFESFGYGIAEAMAKGIKPIIHNFVFSKEVWPEKYLFNTIEEAVDMIISDEYNSLEYRNFIEENYSFDEQIRKIKEIVADSGKWVIDYKGEKKDKNIRHIFYNGKEIKFYLPNQNDYIQKVIYQNKSFYEVSMLEDIAKRVKKGSVIVDIGANIGNHTVFFGKVCEAQVFAFEPQSNIFEILKRNVEINNLSNQVSLYNTALGSTKGKGVLLVEDSNNLGSTRVFELESGNVEIITLDSILLNQVKHIEVIKIDVEGMELEVLKGSTQILETFKPLLYVETKTQEEYIKIQSFLRKYKYISKQKFNATPTILFEPISR
jgi:FkbM family methyltransferase